MIDENGAPWLEIVDRIRDAVQQRGAETAISRGQPPNGRYHFTSKFRGSRVAFSRIRVVVMSQFQTVVFPSCGS